jgi:ferrous iron transport protein B
MGLTKASTGHELTDAGVLRRREGDRLITLAGNPNVGKSTLFNLITGMHQHTGNWPGKTVGSAFGYGTYHGRDYTFADVPGAYSLAARSAEEEVARDFICFGGSDAVVVVCDALCLRRNLNLALQTLEVTGSVVLCVNLMDEAEKKGVHVDIEALSRQLGVPVVPAAAGRGQGVEALFAALETLEPRPALEIDYGADVERALAPLLTELEVRRLPLPAGWLAMRLAEGDPSLRASLAENLGLDPGTDPALGAALDQSLQNLAAAGMTPADLGDAAAGRLVAMAEEICGNAVSDGASRARERDRRIDRILTHRIWGYPVMIAMLALVLWLTIAGANAPSALLSDVLFYLGDFLRDTLAGWGVPALGLSILFDGVYRTVAWVVAVMLPPMAIFFPLFTLMEDLGYLPRVAFNLDGFFKKCSACGKQGLTMCMGFGCNAAGVIGCRIIDSPRERLIAILTNSFVPCNGRFPTLITLITVFFLGSGAMSSVGAALMLTGFLVLGILMTLLASKLLSVTVLKGVPSSFTLELPPYRRPQIGQVILRSILDRTLFVLGRAVTVAAPAGLIIWLLANVQIGGVTPMAALAGFLDPAARLIGLDGVILLAFILGLPANEIVVPIIIMCYLSGGSLMELSDTAQLGALLTQSGWTPVTALCVMLFSLMHWPCSTTLLTIKKEAGGWRWAMLAVALPTACGVAACVLVSLAGRLFLN